MQQGQFMSAYAYPAIVIGFGIIVFGGRALLPVIARWQKRLEENLERSKAKHAESN
jgi:hypothetical protein